MRLWCSRWSDVWRCPKAMRKNFLFPGHPKKRIGRSRGSDVLIRQMALRFHYLHSGRLKMQLRWFRWSGISRCPKTVRTYLLPPGHPNKLILRSRVRMIQVDEWPCEIIVCFLDVLKKYLVMSMKWCFRLSRGHTKIFYTYWTTKKATWTKSRRTYNLPSGRLKMRLCWRIWSDVSTYGKAMRTYFPLPGLP
jgi:hypothetical protein